MSHSSIAKGDRNSEKVEKHCSIAISVGNRNFQESSEYDTYLLYIYIYIYKNRPYIPVYMCSIDSDRIIPITIMNAYSDKDWCMPE